MADTPNNTPNTPPISPSAARYGDPRIARDEERSLLGFPNRLMRLLNFKLIISIKCLMLQKVLILIYLEL